MKRLACWASIVTLTCAPLWPQPANHDEKIKSKVSYALEHHFAVSVETTTHRQFQGLVSEAEPDHFVLALQGQRTTFTYTEVERLSWQHHVPRPLAAVIAAAAVSVGLFLIVHFTLEKNG
jgi:hypothetical protein